MGGKSKTLALLLVLLFLISSVLLTHSNVKAQTSGNTSAPAIQWQQRYGGSTEAVSNLIQTSDGGYAFLDLGWSYQYTFFPSSFCKVDSLGNIQWTKTYGLFRALNLVQTSDWGYEISGYWSTYGTTYEYTSTIIKTDSEGNVQWVENYSSSLDLLPSPPPTLGNASTKIKRVTAD